MFRTLAIILSTLLPAFASATPEATDEQVEAARDASRALYPAFVSGAGSSGESMWTESAAEPADEEPGEEDLLPSPEEFVDPFEESEPPPTPAPPPPPMVDPGDRFARRTQVLTHDLATSNTWTATRNHLEGQLEEMRVAILTNAPANEFALLARDFLVDLDVLVEMAPWQAPLQLEGVEYQRDRIEQQVLFLVEDYSAGDTRGVANTNRLISRSMAELHSLLVRSDRDRGWDAIDYTELPGGWNPGDFSLPSFAGQIQSWSGRRLASEYRARFERLQFHYRDRTITDHAWMTYEMGEIARELARRSHEVPIVSREPFRNASLKLDVLAENLRDYLEDSRRPHARRQLYSMNLAIRDVERYLDRGP